LSVSFIARNDVRDLNFFSWLLKSIWQFPVYHVEKFGAQHYLFAVFAIVYYGAPFELWTGYEDVQPASNIYLRAMASGLAFLLIFKDTLPKKFKKYLPLYWYFVLLFCLPFISTYMFLHEMTAFTWLFLSFFLLGILVDWISFIVLTILGVLLAISFVFAEGSIAPLSLVYLNQTFTAYSIFFVILIVSLFLRNRDRIDHERIMAYKDLAAYLAHEMRKPLGLINIGCEGWIKESPHLFEVYERAYADGEGEAKINPLVLASLKNLPQEFQRTARDGLLFIDMLLMQTETIGQDKEFETAYAMLSIKKVVERWQAGAKRNTRIELQSEQDFIYYGSPILLEYVLLELFRNSEYFFADQKSPEIKVWCESTSIGNEIHVRDNGQGIVKEDLKHVFKWRFSKRCYGTGIGLNFCKTVMKRMGGNIDIQSMAGSFTEVTIYFPQHENGEINA